jgi:hypothetical protein
VCGVGVCVCGVCVGVCGVCVCVCVCTAGKWKAILLNIWKFLRVKPVDMKPTNFMPKTVYRKPLFFRLFNKMFSRRSKGYVMHVVRNVLFIPHFSSAACTSESCRPLGQDKEEILCLLLSTELLSVEAKFIIHKLYIVLIYLLLFFLDMHLFLLLAI